MAVYGGDGGPAVDARLNRPDGVVLDRDGNVFIADPNNNRVRNLTFSGDVVPPATRADDRANDQ